MTIEEEILKRKKLQRKKLEPYGFQKEKDKYYYQKNFFDHSFQAQIAISKSGKLTGKVIDLDTKEEYTNFRIENVVGDFANKVKEEYENILKDIAKNCYKDESFIYPQSNRIADRILEKYQVKPEFLWNKFPSDGVFRNQRSDKWFGLIMNINKSKLDKTTDQDIEILNVKLDDLVEKETKKEGIYPGYHLSKKSWVTIILDDTLTDEKIMDLIDISFSLSDKKEEWLIPANPNYYDITGAFNNTDILTWKQSSNVLVGDTVYIYVGKPYSAILYQCEAVEVNIPYEYQSKDVSMHYVMKLKLKKKYKEDEFTLDKLKAYGVKSIRGPRSIPAKLSKELKNEINDKRKNY